MNTVIDQVSNLLDAEKEKMLQYEQATLALLECAPDDVEHYIIERDKLATEVDELMEQIGRLCTDAPGGELLLQTACGKTELGKVPGEYHPVFHAAAAVQGVVARVARSNRQAMEHVVALRDEALEAIKQNQNLPKIRRYLTGLTEGGERLTLHDGKA